MQYFLKRMMDLSIGLITLIVFSPFFIIIAIAIKIDSKGPVFFKQGRLTINGKLFTMIKFRTMIKNAEKIGAGLFNYENDSRVTRVGKFLRKTSLDELPQIINIIRGDMAIVGPRPPVSYELGTYENLNDQFKRRFTVLPGLTGLAQIIGRNDLPWEKKVFFDNQYIDLFKKYGIFIDIKIIVLTIINIFKMKAIYEVKEERWKDLPDEEIAINAEKIIHESAKK